MPATLRAAAEVTPEGPDRHHQRPAWRDVLSPVEEAVYRDAGYGESVGWGSHPALLIVDATYAFTGDRPRPVLESIRTFPNSCGEIAWESLTHIRRLLDSARDTHVPVFFTRAPQGGSALTRGSWDWKHGRSGKGSAKAQRIGNDFPRSIAPRAQEAVVEKTKPSAFFGTPLLSYLTGLAIDTLVVAGGTTSGCVRATVVDAFSRNLRCIVAEEAVFDRAAAPHRANLFDIHAKYGDVCRVDEIISHFQAHVQPTSEHRPVAGKPSRVKRLARST